MPSFIDLHTHATAGHVTSFACAKLHSTCSPNTSNRSLAWSHHTITKIYAIRRDRPETHVHETLPANRARLLDQTGAKQWPLFSRSRQSLSGHDRSNARRPRTGRGRGPWWQRGGVVSLDGRCSAQAEQRKKPVAVVHLPGAYLSTETNLVPIRGVMRKEFDTGQTHTHTELKRCGPPGPRRFAHVTLGKNKHQLGLCFLLEACQRNAAGWSTAVWLANAKLPLPHRRSSITRSCCSIERSSAKLLVFTCTSKFERSTGSESVRVDALGLRAVEIIICMITRDFSVISMTSQASLSLSLPLTKVTDAQYRKRGSASYNMGRYV